MYVIALILQRVMYYEFFEVIRAWSNKISSNIEVELETHSIETHKVTNHTGCLGYDIFLPHFAVRGQWGQLSTQHWGSGSGASTAVNTQHSARTEKFLFCIYFRFVFLDEKAKG